MKDRQAGQAATPATRSSPRRRRARCRRLIKDPKIVGPIMKSVWQQYTATAEKFNEPGRFTAMIGYEWTSVPGGNNLHRNVLFRDNKDKADQILPFSSWQSEDPEKLWEWMEKYEQKTGGKLLAIPHNGNLSNGRMFELVDFAGKPLSKDYAERRARWEVLQEMMQTKGASETHPTLSPNDEFADFGIAGWEYGNLTLEGKPLSQEMMPTNYLRERPAAGPRAGAEARRQPVQVRLHRRHRRAQLADRRSRRTTSSASTSTRSQAPTAGSTPRSRASARPATPGTTLAAGYAAVWATENTREALWDAMKRKEVYATSGSRMTVRFFGGWDFARGGRESRYLADAGYAKGVPMGGDLPKARRPAKAPTFLVAAIKDPQAATSTASRSSRAGSTRPASRRRRSTTWPGARRPAQAGRGRQAAAGGRYRRRGHRHLDEHHRRPGARRRSGRTRTSTRRCAPSTTRASSRSRRRAGRPTTRSASA